MEALIGTRVVEFTFGMVGPLCGALMAHMGAEVIRVETMRNPDMVRIWIDPITRKHPGFNRVPEFNDMNLDKLGIRLNMATPRGLELARQLVSLSDIVIENFSAGAIDRLGLGYPELKKIKPDIIMASASGSGHTGPEAGMLSIAPIFVAISGLGEMAGYPDSPPFEGRTSPDATNSFALNFAVLSALWYHQRTGQGQYIDHSSREGLACLIGDAFMEYQMTGRVPSRQGNRDELLAPHNCYRCRGEDHWISLVIATDEEWQRLGHALGDPTWARDSRFATPQGRLAHQDELDRLVQAWTLNYTTYEATGLLQGQGVAAFPSMTAEDIYTDPHLAERGMLEVIDHPEIGATMVFSNPWKMSLTPSQIHRSAPLIGQDNEYVFGQLLGLSSEEIARLEQEKVLW